MTTVEILLKDGRRMAVTCATVEDAVLLADSIDPTMLPYRTISLVPAETVAAS
jgi:hypothetical protein